MNSYSVFNYGLVFTGIYSNLNHDENKKLFLNALLTQNNELLSEVIMSLEIEGINDELKDLFIIKTKKYFDEIPKDEALNSDLLKCIQQVLATEKGETLLLLLLTTLQSIPETSSSAQPKGILSMRVKKQLLPNLLTLASKSAQEKVIAQLTDLSYDPSLPSFRPSLDSSYIKSGITLEEYRAATKGPVDISEFLVLTIGLFDKCKEKLPEFLIPNLSSDYLFTNYEDGLNKIRAYCAARLELFNKFPLNVILQLSLMQKNIFAEVLALSNKLSEFNPHKNSTRKFFETRLSQYIVGLSHDEKTILSPPKKQISDVKQEKTKNKPVHDDGPLRDATLRAVNKILIYYLGDKGEVQNPRQMEVNISIFANGYKDKSRFSIEKIEHILAQSKAYAKKDRVSRGNGIKERKYEAKSGDVGESVWNSSGGTMDRITPTFLDSQVYPPLRNMLVDTTTKAMLDEKKGQWGHERGYAAYVGSISGHTGGIIGMLENYMRDNKDDLFLNEDMNLFLVQLVAVYAKRGFHGMLEIIDMLHDESNQKVFNDYGVSVDLEELFASHNLYAKHIEYAMNDTLAYTKNLTLKRAIVPELERVHSERSLLRIKSH